ncbi:MAG: hypothetical protein IPJ20_27715 [Flammeovirgaceae bacterium]|nr:hypothetical protein [Flammeovirgaceae bacterium]
MGGESWENDNFENIIQLCAPLAAAVAGKDIALHFKSDDELNSIILSMEKRKSFSSSIKSIE